MENEKLKRINSFLAKYETSCDILPKNRVQQLLIIDDAIQSRIAHIKGAEEVIKQQSINIQNVAFDTSISRKTFYNNELLRLYVEYYADEVYSARNDSREENKRLKEKISKLEETIQKFALRDIETEELRRELKATQQELSHFITANEELKRQCEKLLNEKGDNPLGHRCKITKPIPSLHIR